METEMTNIRHDSDCAVNNEPAFAQGPCNCTAPWREVERLYNVLEGIVDIQVDIPPEDLVANIKASAAFALWGDKAAEVIASRANG
jgi:hypothetical protein